jgi:tRNA threonylcarbamoyladenosine biosynthesis protein TsaE
VNRYLPDESESVRIGCALGRALAAHPAFLTLCGDLGAGKTTLVRAALRELGQVGPVRSPTYTLIESYTVPTGCVHHLDWYRLAAEEDLEGVGFRDVLGVGESVLVEWPERIPSVAQRADLALTLAYEGAGRRLLADARTPTGERLCARWMTEIG